MLKRTEEGKYNGKLFYIYEYEDITFKHGHILKTLYRIM